MTLAVRVHVEVFDATGISRSEKLTVLRGQLSLIRRRAEIGIPVSVESIARAEEIVRNLEILEAAA